MDLQLKQLLSSRALPCARPPVTNRSDNLVESVFNNKYVARLETARAAENIVYALVLLSDRSAGCAVAQVAKVLWLLPDKAS